MSEQKIAPENPFLKEKGIETAASTNLVAAGSWLNNNETPIKLFERLAERYGKGKRQNVHSEIGCEIIAVSSWRAQNRPELVVQVQENLLKAFERAKELGFQQELASSIAAVAETNGQPIEKVIDLIKTIKSDTTFTSMEWTTAISMASAVYAENMQYEDVRNIYSAVSKIAKQDETTHCALMQAAILSSPEEVTKRYTELMGTTIVKTGWLGKGEKVTPGSKAFLVLAETIGKGKLNPEHTVAVIQTLIKDKKISQATAVRLLLAEANKTAEKPVLNRQGSYGDGEKTTQDFKLDLDLGINMGASIPLDGKHDGKGMNMVFKNSTEPNIISFALALRLGNNRY